MIGIETPSLCAYYTGGGPGSHPLSHTLDRPPATLTGLRLLPRREESVEATVSEIHGYPQRPEGYSEPLFHDRKSRKEILEHLAGSSWLWRASEQAAPAPRAPSGARDGRVVRVISRWREIDRWWEPDGGVDAVWSMVEGHELDRGGERVWAEHQRMDTAGTLRTVRTVRPEAARPA